MFEQIKGLVFHLRKIFRAPNLLQLITSKTFSKDTQRTNDSSTEQRNSRSSNAERGQRRDRPAQAMQETAAKAPRLVMPDPLKRGALSSLPRSDDGGGGGGSDTGSRITPFGAISPSIEKSPSIHRSDRRTLSLSLSLKTRQRGREDEKTNEPSIHSSSQIEEIEGIFSVNYS